MNYARLAMGWTEFLVMLIMVVWTIRTFAKEPAKVKMKTLILLVGGTVSTIIVSSIYGVLFVYRWTMIVGALTDWLALALLMAAVVAGIRYVRGKRSHSL